MDRLLIETNDEREAAGAARIVMTEGRLISLLPFAAGLSFLFGFIYEVAYFSFINFDFIGIVSTGDIAKDALLALVPAILLVSGGRLGAYLVVRHKLDNRYIWTTIVSISILLYLSLIVVSPWNVFVGATIIYITILAPGFFLKRYLPQDHELARFATIMLVCIIMAGCAIAMLGMNNAIAAIARRAPVYALQGDKDSIGDKFVIVRTLEKGVMAIGVDKRVAFFPWDNVKKLYAMDQIGLPPTVWRYFSNRVLAPEPPSP